MLTNEELITVLTAIVLPSALVIFLTFVPSLIEWKKPRDAGPRLIPGFFKQGFFVQKGYLFNVDAELDDQPVPK